MSPSIINIHGREILDSRGRPTVEVDVTLAGGTVGRSSVPSGASTGRHEALELRDGGQRYGGLGVRCAVRNVNEVIAPQLLGSDANDQATIDAQLLALDGTADKSSLGANALLGVSLAVARAAAAAAGLPLWQYLGRADARTLPLPMINIISGGLHARHNLDFQDFLIIAVGADSYAQALEMSVAVYAATERLLAERGLTTLKADEGGFGPPLPTHAAALALLMQAVARAGYRAGDEIAFALDVAASHFYDQTTGQYRLESENQEFDRAAFVDKLDELARHFPIVSIEDGLAEDDWPGWQLLTARLGNRIQLVGDDLFATNPRRLERGIAGGVANAVLVKPNQIGTLSETIEVVRLAQRAGYRVVFSARSGETEDGLLADLAVATNAGQIKIGSVAQSERLAKYNQLLRIEEALGADAVFLGRRALATG